MLDHAREARSMAADRSRADLDADRQLELALTRLMEVVGEACTRVPQTLRSRHPSVPWRQVTALRNRLIHGYDDVDLDILWTIVSVELGPLIEQLERILAEEAAG